MSIIFDFLTSPLSLNISPIIEWIIMAIVGEFSYRYAFFKVGEFDLGFSFLNSIAHWSIRFFTYFMLWSLCRLITDGYNLISVLIKSI